MIYDLKAIATGKIEDLPYSSKTPMRSALKKQPFTGRMWRSKTGRSEDEEEYNGHGGPSKAVMVKSQKEYTLWNEDDGVIPEHVMFGGDLTVKDLDDKYLHCGDQCQPGQAILQGSELRGP